MALPDSRCCCGHEEGPLQPIHLHWFLRESFAVAGLAVFFALYELFEDDKKAERRVYFSLR